MTSTFSTEECLLVEGVCTCVLRGIGSTLTEIHLNFLARLSRKAGPAQVCLKRGCSPRHWPHKSRPEQQVARRLRWTGTSASHVPDRRASQRLQGCCHAPSIGSRRPIIFWRTKAMTPTGSAKPCRTKVLSSTSLRRKIENNRSLTTRNCTSNATRSKACSDASRTGVAYQLGTTDVLTPSSRQSALQPLSYGGFNES